MHCGLVYSADQNPKKSRTRRFSSELNANVDADAICALLLCLISHQATRLMRWTCKVTYCCVTWSHMSTILTDFLMIDRQSQSLVDLIGDEEKRSLR